MPESAAAPPPPAVPQHGELQALRDALDAQIPARKVDRNLLIATWNIRAFGDIDDGSPRHDRAKAPKRDLRAVNLIAEIVSRFDVVAIQEVRGNIKGLREMLKLLGPDWAFVLTDVTKGSEGNDERLAFVFDTRRVKPSGLACELVLPDEDPDPAAGTGRLRQQFARTPYAVSFVSSGQTFILVTLHVRWGGDDGDRTGELTEIAEWLGGWAEDVAEWRQNLFCLGDLNIADQDDANFKALTSTGLHVPDELASFPRTVFDTDRKHHHYDQIAWFEDRITLDYEHSAGTFDFRPYVFTELTHQQLSWRMSDHFPLWAEFLVRPTRGRGRFRRAG